MKLRNIIVVMVTFLTVSCAKNDLYDANATTEFKYITATFDIAATKTSLDSDNITPLWSDGDKVLFMNGTSKQEVVLSDDGEPSTEVGVLNSSHRGFTFAVPAEGWDNIYAVYPSSCASGEIDNGKIGIIIPAIQDGTFASANICVAKGTTSIKFKNATSIINISPTSSSLINNDYMYLNADDNILAGEFMVSIDEDNNLSLTAGSNTYKTIKGNIPNQKAAFYAISPINIDEENGDELNISLKVRKSGTSEFATKKYHRTKSLIKNTIYNLKPSFVEEDYNERIIIGEFSVSPTKKVQFAPGNLYWDGNLWKFENTQYDYPTSWNTNHVGNFYWTKTAENSYAQSYSDGDCSITDKFFADGSDENRKLQINGKGGYYTLSPSEWSWLLGYSSESVPGENCRLSSSIDTLKNARFMKIMIDVSSNYVVMGILVFPDLFSWTDAMGTVPTIVNSSSSWSRYSLEQFKAMESAGCVYLPMTCTRDGETLTEDWGFYWTSMPYSWNSTYAYYVYFCAKYTGSYYCGERNSGYSIRLVAESN